MTEQEFWQERVTWWQESVDFCNAVENPEAYDLARQGLEHAQATLDGLAKKQA